MFLDENQRDDHKRVRGYATYLIPYGKKMGKTHVDEFMKVYKEVKAVRAVVNPKNAETFHKWSEGKVEVSTSRGVSLNEIWAACNMTDDEFEEQERRLEEEQEEWNRIWGGYRGADSEKPRRSRSKKVQILVSDLKKLTGEGLDHKDIAKKIRRERKVQLSASQVKRALDGQSQRGYLLVSKSE